MFFSRWVHFPQTYKTASEPIWIVKWPLNWTCLSCPLTAPPSSWTPLEVWVRWRVAAGPSRGATAMRVPSQILVYHLRLCWLRVSLGFLPPSLQHSSLHRQPSQRSAFSQRPGAEESLLTQCSLRTTAQMSHIVSKVRPGKKKLPRNDLHFLKKRFGEISKVNMNNVHV